MNKHDGSTLPEPPFVPIGELVVLKVLLKDKSAGGIVYPDLTKHNEGENKVEPTKGFVVCVGCQSRYVRRGDLVVCNGRLGHFLWGKEKFGLILESHLAGIVENLVGERPEFRVTDWKDHIVQRLGEPACSDPDHCVRE